MNELAGLQQKINGLPLHNLETLVSIASGIQSQI
jgi:hypothetical protein